MIFLLTNIQIASVFLLSTMLVTVGLWLSTKKKKITIGSYQNLLIKVKGVETSPEAIITIDIDGIIVSWNKGAEMLLGYEEAEVINKNLSLIFNDSKKSEYFDIIENLKDGDSSSLGTILQTSVVNKNQTEVLVDITLWLWSYSSKVYYSMLISNFNKIEKLKQEKIIDIFHLSEEINNTGVFKWNVLTDTVEYSKGFNKIFEIETPTTKSDILFKRIHYPDREKFENVIKKMFDEKKYSEIFYSILSRDGHLKKINSKQKPILDSDGALKYIIGTIREIK